MKNVKHLEKKIFEFTQKNMFLYTNLICTKSMCTKSILHQVNVHQVDCTKSILHQVDQDLIHTIWSINSFQQRKCTMEFVSFGKILLQGLEEKKIPRVREIVVEKIWTLIYFSNHKSVVLLQLCFIPQPCTRKSRISS